LVGLVFAAGAVVTWRKWPDLIVDFGQQLYIPWQLSRGAVLYRDIFYMAGGPLSQYWHALLFKLFGPSFLVLICSNFSVTALMLLVCYRQFGRVAGPLCGCAVTLAAVCVFCFGQYVGMGNYNYAAPYSHEMLHGLALSIFALALLADWRERRKIVSAAAAGLCLGLAALAKPDIFLALALTISAGLFLPPKVEWAFRLRSLAALLAGAALPLVGFFLFFLPAGGWRESLRLEFFGWKPMFMGAVLNNPFYQWSLGLDDPFVHLRTMALQTLTVAVAVALAAWLARRTQALAPLSRWSLRIVGAALLALAGWRVNWPEAGGALPAACLATAALLWRRRAGVASAYFFPLLWSVFALLLLSKQGLHPRLAHTGFALAMPAFVGAIFLLGWALPEYLERRHAVPARILRWFALAFMGSGVLSLVHTSLWYYHAKQLPVGRGADVILATGPTRYAVEARTFNEALDWIATNLPPAASLAAIPQGVLLNYLSRHANPTPCLDWNPVMLSVFGATNMDAALNLHPPDYIALVEWRPYDFATVDFGSPTYGSNTLAWVGRNYTRAALFGSPPLHNGMFGIEILKRTVAAGSPGVP
jgi:4-amino-4-deoxy-L-arabinose transferase-like glycosyltransferase